MEKNSSIKIKDRISKKEKRPKGHVEIFETKKKKKTKLVDTSNLVLYEGRNWLMKRAFNQLESSQGTPGVNSYISWLGLGTGGATADILVPLNPTLTDNGLKSQIVINASDSSCANNGKLHPFDNIEFEEDIDNQNEKLIASITTTIGENDANGPQGSTGASAYYDINEAGLFISNSHLSSNFDPDSLKLFARVTFSTIRKFDERQLVFIWKIYF